VGRHGAGNATACPRGAGAALITSGKTTPCRRYEILHHAQNESVQYCSTPSSRRLPSVIGGPDGCLRFIRQLVQEDQGSIVCSFQSSASGSRIGAGSCSSSSTCPLPLQSGQFSPSSIQPRPLQCGQTFIANTFHVEHPVSPRPSATFTMVSMQIEHADECEANPRAIQKSITRPTAGQSPYSGVVLPIWRWTAAARARRWSSTSLQRQLGQTTMTLNGKADENGADRAENYGDGVQGLILHRISSCFSRSLPEA
jgi:hypothetical protein